MTSQFWRYAAAFAAIIVLVAGGYFIWDRYFSEAGLMRRQAALYEKAEKEYIAAMTADTYGGKTPQETLDMFVAALRAEDVELASKYFLLDENASREKWEAALKQTKEEKRLEEIINVVIKAKSAGSSMESYYGFEVRDENGTLIADIGLKFNSFSKVWKIETL